MELSDKLKQQTIQKHKEIEKCTPLVRILRPDLTLEEYTTILRIWYSFIFHYEQQIQNNEYLINLLPDIDTRYKLKLLTKDLENNHLKASTETSELNKIDSPEKYWGYMYVMEGSTLGSQIIVKSLAQNSSIPANCLHFYQGYKEHTFSKWSAFKTALNNWGQNNPDRITDVIAFANIVFDELHQFMNFNYKKAIS